MVDGVGLPALLRMSEKSFRVALFGSTPKEREKSLVARSIMTRFALLSVLEICVLCFGRKVCEDDDH